MTMETKKILVIDDEPDARTLLNRRLSASQYEVVESADGPSGIAVAKEGGIDLIILDLIMPGEDGIKIYHALRHNPQTQNIPVIFLTALSVDASLTERGLELMALTKHGLEMDKYFVVMGKPYDPKKLSREIRRLLGQRDPWIA